MANLNLTKSFIRSFIRSEFNPTNYRITTNTPVLTRIGFTKNGSVGIYEILFFKKDHLYSIRYIGEYTNNTKSNINKIDRIMRMVGSPKPRRN
jgi:hypothetical protein